MATNNQKSVEILEGEVTQAFAPAKNDAGRWRPATIYIETAEGKVKISEWPKSNYDTRITYEPIQMPAWYVSLGDVAHLVGVKVQVVAEYKSTYEGTREYNKTQTFKVLSSLPTPQPTPATTATPAPAWGSLDERIAWNSAINNAASAVGPIDDGLPPPLPPLEYWVAEVDRIAHHIYALIRRGPLPPVEDAPEKPVEAPDPNLEPDPFPEYTDEEDTASWLRSIPRGPLPPNMGVMEV